MNAQRPVIGSAVRIHRNALQALISEMDQRGYEVLGPTIHDSAISYGPIHAIEDLPEGWTSEQGPGSYRLKRRTDGALFGYATGPKSLKNFLHPSEIKLFTAERTNGTFRILSNDGLAPRRAFLGVRACELAAPGVLHRYNDEPRPWWGRTDRAAQPPSARSCLSAFRAMCPNRPAVEADDGWLRR